MATMKPRPWRVCFLPLLDDKDEHAYTSFRDAKNFALGKLDDLTDWCKRYNSAGMVAIDDAKRAVAETEGWFWTNPALSEREIAVEFDSHTGMRVRLRFRKVPT